MGIVFVDFDDTLCMHEKPIMYTKCCIDSPIRINQFVYSNSKPNEKVVSYIKALQKHGFAVKLISSSTSNIIEAMRLWCITNVDGVFFSDFISSGEFIQKKHIIKAYKDKYNLDWQTCILIDDSDKVRDSMEGLGITVVNPDMIEDV